MNVPSDLAEKVLQAGTRNVIADVGEGDKLSGPERELMHMFAMNPQYAQRLRAFEHVKRWCKGDDLTATQWTEVHEIYPEFKSGSPPPAELPPVPDFALAAEPARRELTKAMLFAWGKLYGCGERTARRYHDEGAPLDDPTAMPVWWEGERAAGRKKWNVPEAILLAAKNAAEQSPPASPGSPVETSTQPPQAPGAQTAAPINLEDFDPEEGDRLRELKQIQAARFDQLKTALRAGTDTTLLEAKYVKLCETVDKMESRVTERLKKRGLFVLRPEIERDVAKAAEMIRAMGESEVRRVLELCPALPPDHRDQVAAAIRRVSAARAGVFRMLKSLKTPDDALFQLAAA